MSSLKTFTSEVAKAITDYTEANPYNPNADLPESGWGYGLTHDSTRKLFSLSKLFVACKHVDTGKDVSFGFIMKPGDLPLQFTVDQWIVTDGTRAAASSTETVHVASIGDVPAVIRNAARRAHELAMALHMEHAVVTSEQRKHI